MDFLSHCPNLDVGDKDLLSMEVTLGKIKSREAPWVSLPVNENVSC